jgi:hypothetical protein
LKEYFAAVWEDEAYFKNAFSDGNRLHMPMLALGGEASIWPFNEPGWSGVYDNFVAEAIPKAGHWIGKCFVVYLLV